MKRWILLFLAVVVWLILSFYFADSALLSREPAPVGSSYFEYPVTLPVDFSSLFDPLLLGYFVIAVLLGFSISNRFPIIGRIFHSRSSRLVACSFPLGYLALIGISRVSSIFPLEQQAILFWLFVFLVLAFSTRVSDFWPMGVGNGFRAVCFGAVLVGTMVIFSIQSAGAHVIGDGAIYTVNELIALQDSTRLPLYVQHYDEIAFGWHGFGAHGLAQSEVIPGLLITYSLMRISGLAVFFYCSRFLGTTRSSGVLISALLGFGPLGLFPTRHSLLFDSGSYYLELLHSGRQLIILASVIILSLIAEPKDRMDEPFGRGVINGVVCFLVGIGFTSLTISFLFVMLILSLFAWFLTGWGRRFDSQVNLARKWLILCLVTILFYGADKASIVYTGICLQVVALMTMLPNFATSPSTVWDKLTKGSRHSRHGNGWILILGLAIGYVFGGNLLTSVLPGTKIISVAQAESRNVGIAFGGFGINPFRGDYPHLHLDSAFSVLAFFGLPFLLITLALGQHSRPGSNQLARFSGASNYLLRSRLLLFLIGLSLIFSTVVWNFFNPVDRPVAWLAVWVKSRLVEPWFFLAIFLSLAMLLGTAGVRQMNRQAVKCALCTYLTVANIFPGYTGTLAQWLSNAEFVLFPVSR